MKCAVCGKPVALQQHVFGEGLLDGDGTPKKITRVYWAALYHKMGPDGPVQQFCSAKCSLEGFRGSYSDVDEKGRG